MKLSTLRLRILGALVLFGAMLLLASVEPGLFVGVVTIAFIATPPINWQAWRRLHAKLDQEKERGGPLIESLRLAVDRAWYLAAGSTITAGLGLYVGARQLGYVGPIDRLVFLIGLSFPPLLAALPALDTLRTLRRLEREDVATAGPEA